MFEFESYATIVLMTICWIRNLFHRVYQSFAVDNDRIIFPVIASAIILLKRMSEIRWLDNKSEM